MKFIGLVCGILLLLFGLKFLKSPLFNSLLGNQVHLEADWQILPTLGFMFFGTIIVGLKLYFQSRKGGRKNDDQ